MNSLGEPVRRTVYKVKSLPSSGIEIELFWEGSMHDLVPDVPEGYRAHVMVLYERRTLANYIYRTWVTRDTGRPVTVSEGPG